jgi:hypothetical protein
MRDDRNIHGSPPLQIKVTNQSQAKYKLRREGVKHFERWVLFQSGQFVHNMALDEIPRLGESHRVL